MHKENLPCAGPMLNYTSTLSESVAGHKLHLIPWEYIYHYVI